MVAVRPSSSVSSGSQDGGWQVVFDSGLGASGFAKAFLGVLDKPDGDTSLFLFGSNGQEPAGSMKGVWRWNETSDVWSQLAIPAFDFNGLPTYGARCYKGNLYVGDRRLGKLFKLTLNADGTFASFAQATTVGAEDVFPTVTVQGKLWLGTFGATPAQLQPGFYSYDGTTVTEVLTTDLGVGGSVTGVVWDGNLFYVAGQNAAATVHSIWTVAPDGTSSKVFTETVSASAFLLNAWNDQMIVTRGTPTRFYTYAPPDTFTLLFQSAASFGGNPIGVGDTMYYTRDGTVYRWRHTGEVTTSAAGTGHAVVSWLVYDGYLWMVTNQPVQLWRRKIAPDRYIRAQTIPGVIQ